MNKCFKCMTDIPDNDIVCSKKGCKQALRDFRNYEYEKQKAKLNKESPLVGIVTSATENDGEVKIEGIKIDGIQN